jgi:REP element-mobilizing transposase RayT
MARPLRIQFPGALYHVTSRGDKKEKIFEDDRDREAFLKILASVVEQCNWLCHAYCLMDNHYHLLVETPDGNLSYGMRQLNGVYTQRYNRAHHTVGHLLQGRYKAIVVEKDTYLLEVSRYMVLNPVRAQLVTYPWEWNWSSYLATASIRKPSGSVSTDWILSQFSKNKKRAQQAYREFVISGMEKEAPWKDLKGRIILGRDDFVAKIRGLLGGKEEIKEIPRVERFATRPRLSQIFGERRDRRERDRRLYTAHITYGYTLKEIGDYLRIHYSTVSKALKNLQRDGNSSKYSRFKA